MEQPTCEECPYWELLHINYGLCRKGQPVRVESMTEITTGRWPITWESDFCGEHPDFPQYIESLKEKPTDV